MKQYASKELSERLYKLNCRSQSGFYYDLPSSTKLEAWSDFPRKDFKKQIPKFEFEDFCSTSDFAEINVRILLDRVKNRINELPSGFQFYYKRIGMTPIKAFMHAILDSANGNWIAFIEKVL